MKNQNKVNDIYTEGDSAYRLCKFVGKEYGENMERWIVIACNLDGSCKARQTPSSILIPIKGTNAGLN